MPKHVLFALVAFLGLSITAVAGKMLYDRLQGGLTRQASDAAKVEREYTIAVDSWVGYAPLCADEMARRLADRGIGLRCIDDQADYGARFESLRRRNIDLAVATVDAYLREHQANPLPGTIVAVIDESAGGDAILSRKAVVREIDDLQSKRQAPLRIAFTSASPSEFLMLAVGQHFGIAFGDSSQFTSVSTDGSADALRALQKGKADIAVLWEPDVSRALADGEFVKLIGSEDTEGLIVDILVASPALVANHPDDLRSILAAYFETIDFYDSNRDRRDADIANRLDVKAAAVGALVGGVRWASLTENAVTWFDQGPNGFGGRKLTHSLHATQAILKRASIARQSALSSGEVLSMIGSSTVDQLYRTTYGGSATAATASTGFKELSESEWASLKEIGSLQIEPITFQPGTSMLTPESRTELDRVAGVLQHYPRYRLVVRGHTSDVGDDQANRQLSLKRAKAVSDYLLVAHPIDLNRLRAEGYGGTKPLPREADESLRAWRYRLPRVEIAFMAERR